MRLRLFVFLGILVILMVISEITALLISGFVIDNNDQAKSFLEKELSHVSDDLISQLGNTSVHLVRLSESLSKSIETKLESKNIGIGNLKYHPGVLEEVIENELDRLLYALDRTLSSGVFMILDATVNPNLPYAGHSRAGMSIRIAEPELYGPEMPRRYLRGFPWIAFNNSFILLSDWDMEFDVKDRIYYHLPIEKSSKAGLALPQLYYWGFESVQSESGEPMVLISIPLIGQDGKAFGVCGFEKSDLYFSSKYLPDSGAYREIFCLFSTIDDKGIATEKALFAGNYTSIAGEKKPLAVSQEAGLNTYTLANGKKFLGLHREIKMFPDNSAVSGPHFVMALLVSKDEVDAINFRQKFKLILICAALLAFGIFASLFISRRYLRPILTALSDIQADHADISAKTNIQEIDQLVKQIREMQGKDKVESISVDNIWRIGSLSQDEYEALKLSPREKEVAVLLIQGMTMRQAALELDISEKTVNGYCKTLYKKLGINSRTELFVRFGLAADKRKVTIAAQK